MKTFKIEKKLPGPELWFTNNRVCHVSFEQSKFNFLEEHN